MVWARAVSTVSILIETITPHAWKYLLDLSPHPQLAIGKHPTHEVDIGEMLATLLILTKNRA